MDKRRRDGRWKRERWKRKSSGRERVEKQRKCKWKKDRWAIEKRDMVERVNKAFRYSTPFHQSQFREFINHLLRVILARFIRLSRLHARE